MPLEQLRVKCLAQGHSGFEPGSLIPKACVPSTPSLYVSITYSFEI